MLVAEELWLAALLSGGAIIIFLELSPVSDWVLSHGRLNSEARMIEEVSKAQKDDE